MIRNIAALCASLGVALVLAGCSGGGGGGSSASTPTTTATTTSVATTPVVVTPANQATVTIDAGPAALRTGSSPYNALNRPYVSVTLCAPGSTSNCQTIDHVLLDTGSVGLRILSSVINATLLTALPNQTDGSGNPTGECYGFVDGYMFGSVHTADFTIGGEAVAGMPLQVVADTNGAFAATPSSCSSGGGSAIKTVPSLGANGILGVGTTPTDCGARCTTAGSYGSAIYYDCPTTGCSAIIARASSSSAPFEQLPNPVAAMAVDNNGVIVSLPNLPASGVASTTGLVYFGIGTQSNNGLGSATILATTTTTSRLGAGLISVLYKGKTLTQSYIDSGSNVFFFVDSTIPACTGSGYSGFFCPPTPAGLTATITGQNGVTKVTDFTLYNFKTVASGGYSALTGIAAISSAGASNSFDYGLPFFYGRNMYTAIEGRNAGGTVGPYFAF